MQPSTRARFGLARRAPSRIALLALLACLPCCRSSGGGAAPQGDARSGGLRKVDELPAEYAELWRAWVAHDPDWGERRDAALDDPKLAGFLVDNLVREMIRAWRAGRLTTTRSERLGPFERSRAELLRLGEISAPVLAELAGLAASDVAQISLELLVAIGRPALEPLLGQLGREEAPTARRRAASALAALPPAGSREPAVLELLWQRAAADPDPLVRSSCLLAFGSRASLESVSGELETSRTRLESRLAAEPDPEVRPIAARALARLGDPRAVPALVAYYEETLVEPDIRGMRSALAALRELTGVERTLDARGWRDWWRENRGVPRGDRQLP